MTSEQPIRDMEHIPAPLRPLMAALCEVGAQLAHTIQRGPLGAALGEEVGVNTGGDGQKALDIIADDAFAARLKSAGVRWYASEEQEEVVELDPAGAYALAIDPLDGSSNIDVNVSIGTIFSVFQAKAGGDESVLRPASEQIAGGYIIYGPQTMLVVTFGAGTQEYLLDPDSRQFVLINAAVKVPATSHEFAINASNYRHWPNPIRAYIDDCIAGAEGPRDKDFNMRWVASLVAETHRILSRGGVFLYPGDKRKGYEKGRLRMVYECAPIAFVIEQAGGMATDGQDQILGQAATRLHQRTPFVFGSAEKVARVATYHDLPESEVSALFGKRGLFRA
ncbi:class 1 fructose-bisphosphatase [Actibacterium sp. MT2.3-13A]|uniref:class 1 fructose-bisphosphatase n=1 Tax=Actibacterium sp. MT2.3-13A TaxID=2828332 RepID=UPI001BA5B88A|nr:class 1 fructose-bisphosphatase [Actibacterium sp. MT2.3-13A]